MTYTFVSVWRDGAPVLAYEIPDHTFIGESWAPPMIVRPLADGTHTEVQPREWRDVLRCLARYQANPRYELSESHRPWERGWDVPPVRP